MEANKIVKGNAYELIKELPDKSVDLIYTDIPYEISYNGGGSLKNKINKALKVELNNNDTLTKGIDYSILDEFCRVLKHIYIYGVVKTKYFQLWNIFAKKIVITIS